MKRHSDMQKVLGWLLPQHSSRAMPDSGSVLPTSPRHQAAHAFVSATSPALICILQHQIDSMPGKMLDDAGEMPPSCLAVHLQSQRLATAIKVSKRMAFPSRSLYVGPKAAAMAANQQAADETVVVRLESRLERDAVDLRCKKAWRRQGTAY